MDNSCIWEQKTIINELTQGMELTKQLMLNLSSESSSETRELLIQRILSSHDKALLILKLSESTGQPQPVAPMSGLPESPISINDSPRSGDIDCKAVSKKRKGVPAWTEQVRICTDNGLEGNTDDGYSWRKYGQKDILGAKFPRSYYRCTYRNIHNCWARKQVQRTDEDHTVFEITYKGKHTCNQATQSVPPPASPEKHEMKHNHHYSSQQQQKSDEILSNLRANLSVNTEDLDNTAPSPFSFPSASFGCMMGENQHFPFSMLVNDELLHGYSPSFISPATSASNYFTGSACQMNSMISANTSATNSPIGYMAFSTDPNLDPNFPFDTPGFF